MVVYTFTPRTYNKEDSKNTAISCFFIFRAENLTKIKSLVDWTTKYTIIKKHQ